MDVTGGAVDRAMAGLKADIPLAEAAANDVIERAVSQLGAMIESLLNGYTVTISVSKKA